MASFQVLAKQQKIPRRIIKEIQRIKKHPIKGISITPHKENLRYMDIVIAGPPDCPYAGGLFKLEMFLGPGYPIKPPKVRFLTRVYHPNIDRLGRICLDILKADKGWSAALQMDRVCLSIQLLLATPNPDDPLDNKVAAHWKANEASALKTAAAWTKKYAM